MIRKTIERTSKSAIRRVIPRAASKYALFKKPITKIPQTVPIIQKSPLPSVKNVIPVMNDKLVMKENKTNEDTFTATDFFAVTTVCVTVGTYIATYWKN